MSLSPHDESALAQGRSFQWHELHVPDLEAAIEFYTNALGFECCEMEMGSERMYRMLTREGRPICGLESTQSRPGEDVAPHWATYLWVDDVDARVDKCLELGAKLIVPAVSIPTVGRMAKIEDPQGATIWLFKGE
jgi:predicted enzyme related to lactoylglutathione lyase